MAGVGGAFGKLPPDNIVRALAFAREMSIVGGTPLALENG